MFCLYVLRFNIPVNNISVMSGQSLSFLGINKFSEELTYLTQGHNTVPQVGIESSTSRYRVQCANARPTQWRGLLEHDKKTPKAVISFYFRA